MHPNFVIPPLWQSTRQLAAVARGAADPAIILRGVRPVCVFTERVLPESEVWMACGRIAAVKPAGTWRGRGVPVIDGGGTLVGPGLIDAHVHIESSMMTACAYAEAALANGTTTIFCDSHEIANVCDRKGVEWMLEDARAAALNIFLTVPSTVPATHDGLETAGGDLTPDKIGDLFDAWPEAVALGEKMDFVAVAAGEERSHAIIAEALKRGRPVSGHVYGLSNVDPYAASGVTDTHEATSGEIAEALLRAGVWIFLRGGPPTTPWHSLPEAIKAITELGCNPKRVCLCTDDRDADDLFLFGIDWVLRQAMARGIATPVAWSMGSLHAAQRYHLDQETGSLGAGRRADLVLLDDHGTVRGTWLSGREVMKNGAPTDCLVEALGARWHYPAAAYETVRLPAHSVLCPTFPEEPATASVIGLPGGIETDERTIPWPGGATNPEDWMREHQLCHLAVVERHGRRPGTGHGFLQGFGLRAGAVASTVGHDAHNLIVAGTNEPDMQAALEALREARGGVCVVQDGQVVALVALPVAGLLSDLPAREVAAQTDHLKKAWTAAGCQLAYMGFNLLPLSVIPEFRLTDRGLVRVSAMEIIPLWRP
jgi:adenine deaminase